MKKVIVLGSNSFSGSHFVNYLLEKTNYEVIGISRSPEPHEIFLPYKNKSRFKFYQLDLNRDLNKILEIIKTEFVEYVVNYAAQGMVGQSWENPTHWIRTNTLSLIALADELRKLPQIKKFVQVSTPEVYGSCIGEENMPYNPTTPYAISKSAADMFLQAITKQFNFPAVFTRSANVYGSGQQLYRIIPICIIKIKKGEKIQLEGGGFSTRAFIHIRDNCEGTLRVMEDGKPGEAYHLSSGINYRIKEVVKIICNKMGVSFEEAVQIAGGRIGQDKEYTLNSDKARRELGWAPKRLLGEGIDECIDWVNKNWDVIKELPCKYIHKE